MLNNHHSYNNIQIYGKIKNDKIVYLKIDNMWHSTISSQALKYFCQKIF